MGIDWEAFRGRATFVVGADKNCGKTTFMNLAAGELRSRGVALAYLSAGVDGEALDYLTGAPKPAVVASPGDLLVTAETIATEAEAGLDIIRVAGEDTVLGRQALARATSGGRVELVGPAGNRELAGLLALLREKDPAAAILVDGAVDRLTQVGSPPEAAYVLVLKVAPASFDRMVERARLALLLERVPTAREGDGGAVLLEGALTESKLGELPEGELVLEDLTRVFVSSSRLDRLMRERGLRFARSFPLAGIVANMDRVGEAEFLAALGEEASSSVTFFPFGDSAVAPATTEKGKKWGQTPELASRSAGVSPASGGAMRSKLGLPHEQVERARELASRIVEPVHRLISEHTTVTVERATLRLLGCDGAGPEGVPAPNLAVDSLTGKLGSGAAICYVNALVAKGVSPDELNRAIAGGLDLASVETAGRADVEARAAVLVDDFDSRVSANVAVRREMLEEYRDNEHSPLLYVIVATGDIHEDVKQATGAALQGADAIAVIRTTAQSLLDYVPYGATTEGFGGTYATQENFRIMREALDDASRRTHRYVRLVNYASGLCMPEIAVMAALERLDMLLNDSMYGVLFRDINISRTFIDQHFSRMINAFADILINSGEDNYLTTSDAFEKAYTVLASQFINERFALDAGLPPRLIGLGHAFEMDPGLENGFLYEVAQAQMAREIFPDCPLKYMPPTKFVTGDIFQAYAMNTMFNFASKATGQSIHLLGMLTEGIHTPFMQDRKLAIDNALYVMNNIASFADEVEFRADGLMARRARQVLGRALAFLEEVERQGLFESVERGLFADIERRKDGGKGADGVVRKEPGYWNPVEDHLRKHSTGDERRENAGGDGRHAH
ncbi:MAG TPA: lysine 5,6-aminomutase subunit alpha [Candidatus Anoxymicrobiaceae bacterium]